MSNTSTQQDEAAAALSIAGLRAERGETLEEFGRAIGVGSKGRVSEIERGVLSPTPEQALAIERLSGGRIDAAGLNALIAEARAGAGGGAVHASADTPIGAQHHDG